MVLSSLHGERGRVVWSHGSEGLHEMWGLERVGGRVVWSHGSEGLHENEGHEGVGEGGLFSRRMGQKDYLR